MYNGIEWVFLINTDTINLVLMLATSNSSHVIICSVLVTYTEIRLLPSLR